MYSVTLNENYLFVMLRITFFTVYSVISLATGADPPTDYYTTRYDHVDVENILNQKRLVQYYAACLLDKGPCTPQGMEFKNILPDAIKTNCLRCTEKQRLVTVRSIRRLRKEYPDIWGQLEKKWDPSGENVKRLLSSESKPTSQVELLFDRFGGDESLQDENTTAQIIERDSSLNLSTTIKILTTIATSTSTQTTPTKDSFTVIKPIVHPITSRPFNSVGPNLIVPNPKAIIDKVIYTAGTVLNTVTNTVTTVLQG